MCDGLLGEAAVSFMEGARSAGELRLLSSKRRKGHLEQRCGGESTQASLPNPT